VDLQVDTNISEEHVAFIFMADFSNDDELIRLGIRVQNFQNHPIFQFHDYF
jgi:hypothetical protein